jgi:hypothetical protein
MWMPEYGFGECFGVQRLRVIFGEGEVSSSIPGASRVEQYTKRRRFWISPAYLDSQQGGPLTRLTLVPTP